MTLATIQRPSTLVEEVCQRLVRELRRDRSDEWLPPERALATQLGVSRTVVREATKRLELQGLVEVLHGVGIRRSANLHKPLNGSLALLIPDEAGRLNQSLEVRLAIEPEVARVAAIRATSAQLRELRKAHARLEQATELPDAVEADINFHRALARATGNEIFGLLLETLSDLGRESRMATISHAGVKRAIEHHAAILNAVSEGDEAAAAKAMRHHIEVAIQDLEAQTCQSTRSALQRTKRSSSHS